MDSSTTFATHTSRQAARLWLASVAFYAGLALVLLCGIEAVQSIGGLPRFWYNNQIVWLALGLTAMGVGFRIQTNPNPEPPLRWKPTFPGQRFHQVVIYTRPGCTLCEEAYRLLVHYRKWLPTPVEVDLDTDARLASRFGQSIPVVLFDGKIRFRGEVSELLLRRLIEGTRPVEESSVGLGWSLGNSPTSFGT